MENYSNISPLENMGSHFFDEAIGMGEHQYYDQGNQPNQPNPGTPPMFNEWILPDFAEEDSNVPSGEMNCLQYLLPLSREIIPYTTTDEQTSFGNQNYSPETVSSSWAELLQASYISSSDNLSLPSDFSSPRDFPVFSDSSSPGQFSPLGSPYSLINSPPTSASPPLAEGVSPYTDFNFSLMEIDPELENEVNQDIPFSELSFDPSIPIAPVSPDPRVTIHFPSDRIYPIVKPPPHVDSPCPPISPRSGHGPIDPSPSRRRRPSNPSGIVKRYRCNFPGCLKVCERPCDLKKHKKRHEKPFMCRYTDCGSCGFSTEKDRERHEKSKHKKSEHLVCIRCGHSTARKDNMKDHVRRRHMDYDLEETMALIMRTEGAGCASPTDQD